jgi:hypothetical protein
MSVFGVFKVLEPESCPVCLEPLQFGQDVYEGTACAHVFHKQCAETWVSKGKFSCPTCRKPWNKDEFKHVLPQEDANLTKAKENVAELSRHYGQMWNLHRVIDRISREAIEAHGVNEYSNRYTGVALVHLLRPPGTPLADAEVFWEMLNLFDWDVQDELLKKLFCAICFTIIKRIGGHIPVGISSEIWNDMVTKAEPQDALFAYQTMHGFGVEVLDAVVDALDAIQDAGNAS